LLAVAGTIAWVCTGPLAPLTSLVGGILLAVQSVTAILVRDLEGDTLWTSWLPWRGVTVGDIESSLTFGILLDLFFRWFAFAIAVWWIASSFSIDRWIRGTVSDSAESTDIAVGPSAFAVPATGLPPPAAPEPRPAFAPPQAAPPPPPPGWGA
jgi:hypothetical protein